MKCTPVALDLCALETSWNLRCAGSKAQKSAAFDSYFHYAGPWRIEGEEVVHEVAMSLNPDMTGTEQRRLAQFDGQGGLILSAYEDIGQGRSRHHILQWSSAA